MFLPRCFWNYLPLAALVGIVLTGCHQIPSSRSNWGGGVGEYTVEDDEIRDQWRKAAAGTDPNSFDAKTPDRASDHGPSEEERFDFVKRFFTKSDDKVSKKPVDQQQPERLTDDERFFSADDYSAPTKASQAPSLGKIVPIQKNDLPLSADSVAVRQSEPIPEPTAESAVKIASIRPQRTVSSGDANDLSPLIESIHSRAEERQPSNAVFLFPEYSVPVNNSTPSQNTLSGATKIKQVAYFEKAASFNSVAQNDKSEIESKTDAETPAEPAKLSVEPNLIRTADPDQTASARKIILASPLAFLSEPGPTIKPVTFDSSPNQAGDNWRIEARRAAERLRVEIDRQATAGQLDAAEVARLRLLLLATGDNPESVCKIAATKPELAEFWDQQCRGLKAVIASQENGSNESLPVAAGELAESLGTLKTACPVTIQKALFAEAAAPFGLYRPRSGSYQPGTTAFVYLELDNVVSKRTETGFELAAICRWELLNALGQPVGERHEQLCSNRSASPLKDVVLNIPAQLPESLSDGDYTMRITIKDQNAAQSFDTQSNLPLTVRR